MPDMPKIQAAPRDSSQAEFCDLNLTLGIKLMESLTLPHFRLISYCGGNYALWQATACGLLGTHHDMSTNRLKNGSSRSRTAEWLGSGSMALSRHERTKTKSRSQPARDDREGRLRQRLAVRPDLRPRDRRRSRRPLVRLPHVLQLARRRRGAALHLRLRRPHPDRAPQRHPCPAGPDQREDVARPLRSVDRRRPADVPPRHSLARHRRA